MDPHLVFDCQKVLPNRFALTLAAAARSRALARGAEPRLDTDDRSASELALHEIAACAFCEHELEPFLPGADGRRSLPPPDPDSRLCGGGCGSAAAAPASRARETVH
ncbi:DNA-directed RNA polymerase subunit omega [Shinella sp. BYT-45]|uniref:DNA-directed RNA polymerase subunit omega n=1 Tax=Shinella sp. BYT-45 TaxID=3377377 RepID=UPI0039800F25